jgi:hypothetical protein
MRGFLAALVAAAAALKYVPTPVGYMREDCVHTLPSGSVCTKTRDGGVDVQHSSGDFSIARCSLDDGHPMMRADMAAAPGVHVDHGSTTDATSGSSRKLQLPADYDGWLQYTRYENADIGTFIGTMSVPATSPTESPDVLYYFPGLQNVDWIPKVDPWPTGLDFDVIQPVLQFPGGSGRGWSVRSWWVTVDVGALASKEIVVQPGAIIGTNMTKTSSSPPSWFINSVVNGKGTSIVASGLSGNRLASQPWAYVTMECYGCTSCANLPAGNSSSLFGDMRLYDTDGALLPSWNWTVNPKPAKDRTCASSTEVVDPSNVVIFSGAP